MTDVLGPEVAASAAHDGYRPVVMVCYFRWTILSADCGGHNTGGVRSPSVEREPRLYW